MNIISSDSVHKTAQDILMYYINHANLEAGYALLQEKEIDLNLKNNIGMTPLLLAVKNNNLSYTNLLLDFGANPNSKTDAKVGGESGLTIASEMNYFDIASILIDYGADPNERNSQGLTCLHLCAKNGHLSLMTLLLSRGADVNVRDDFGNNAAYYAKRFFHEELLEFLTPPETVTPEILIEYKDQVDEKRFEITADDKKKIRAQIAKDLKAEEAKQKAKGKKK